MVEQTQVVTLVMVLAMKMKIVWVAEPVLHWVLLVLVIGHINVKVVIVLIGTGKIIVVVKVL